MYTCQYPNCDYTTLKRFSIDRHHILPVELGGSDKSFNRIFLCPTHHRHIYVPESMNGLHSFKEKGSIIIKGFIKTTAGKALHYIDCEDNIEYAYIYSRNAKIPL